VVKTGGKWENIPNKQLSEEIRQKLRTQTNPLLIFPDTAECLAGLAFKDAAWPKC